uniref:Eukaryotic translation initiation factor 3 subunit B n=1 Tax=Strombidinopsis acuminata TaxID=141414 RepID=A0A7S3WP66_9SPIT|mmetsp:Transcript_49216/g.66980  ORF Transcript_49216/g.66980 Transcript_49216/m.66980 type:complete len:681 (+) Transcript_49216:51-2093(+)
MPSPSAEEPDDEIDDLEEEPQLDTSFKQTVVVDGLPVVTKEKHEKLLNVVRKFFSQVGTIIEDGLDLPVDDSGSTLGFAFIQFSAKEEAQAAIVKANGYKLDKSHTFIVNSFEDYAKYMAISDVEQPFVPPPYVPRENLHHWLLDEGARDQFVLRYNDETEIWWNDPGKPDQKPDHSKKHWSERLVCWSPRGAYLATFHRLGVQLWGGPSWSRQLKLSHGGVRLINFSPCEKFLVTWSPEGDPKQAYIIWDLRTGAKARAFAGAGEEEVEDWPVFRWSHDDQFVARIGVDCIYVYESSTMKLLKDKNDKRSSIKVDGVRQFLWSPTDNIMSLWIPEHMNNPAKVILMELPSRTELRQKNLFQVAHLHMTWHDQGHFLCVKVDKHSKSKRTLNSAFELFRLRDKGVPIEVQEFSKDQSIFAFAWEPRGIRFALVHADATNANRTDVSVYSMGSRCNGRVSLIKTFERKPCNALFWSPAGGILLLANLKGTGGNLEWIDANTSQTIGEAEHFMCSNVEWDPTGRFVTTSVSHWRHQMENGYNLWTSHGRQLDHKRYDKLHQLLWRPRPPSLLSEAKEKEIRKNLRDYSRKYEAEDAKLKNLLKGDELKARQEKQRAFEEFLRIKAEDYKMARQARIDLRGGVESDNESAYTLVEEQEEEELDYKEEVIGMVEEGSDIEIGDD